MKLSTYLKSYFQAYYHGVKQKCILIYISETKKIKCWDQKKKREEGRLEAVDQRHLHLPPWVENGKPNQGKVSPTADLHSSASVKYNLAGFFVCYI